MGDVIDFRLPASVYARTEETYRLLLAFTQIKDEAIRARIIAMAEAAGTARQPVRAKPGDRTD